MATEPVKMDFSAAASAQTTMQFDVRSYFNSFQRPPFIDILNAVRDVFPNDGGIVVREGYGGRLGLYTVFSNSQPTENFVNLQRRRRGQSGHDIVKIPLSAPMPHRERSRDGLLITIVDANLGPDRAIPGSEFDAALEAFGSIERYTEVQKYRETNFLNGNRYCVITRDPEKELPNRLAVRDKTYLIKYKDKKWSCSSCAVEHVGACPYRKKIFEARDKRKNLDITHHLVSDSSLRLAEESGLCAEISCMSGATVGQLANAVDEEGGDDKLTSFVFVGGANDTKPTQTESDREIAKKIDASLQRLVAVASKPSNENKSFYILNAVPHIEVPTRRQFVAQTYFKERLSKLCVQTENLDQIKAPDDPSGWGSDLHPTRSHTESMILSITKDLNKDIMVDPGVISTEKYYRGVQGHYLSGCTGCSALGIFRDGGFCPECVTKMSNVKKLADEKLFKRVIRQTLDKFPQAQKRLHSDDDGEFIESSENSKKSH